MVSADYKAPSIWRDSAARRDHTQFFSGVPEVQVKPWQEMKKKKKALERIFENLPR